MPIFAPMNKKIICCLLFFLSVVAHAQEATDSVSTQESKSTLKARLHQVQQYLDAKARAQVDPHYIEVPDKPWRVILRYNASVFDVDYSNTGGDPSAGDGIDWEMCFEPPMASSIGLWAGYRGTGIGFSKSLSKKKGTTFSFSTTGAKYGASIRLRSFDIDEVTITSTIYEDGTVKDNERKGYLNAPANITSLYLNGYYVFNGRRYSQAAAYNQSVIQRRSAGSFLLGATWYQSSFDYSDIKNSIFMELARSVGRIKVHQANIGIGYGYNFVPFRGFVINAMAMPTFSVYNRVKIYKYDFNYSLFIDGKETDNYGEWNSETKTWANGEIHKPLTITDDTIDYPDDAECWEVDSEIENSWFHVNLDFRLGIAYNWRNYFIGLQGQYNNFHYKKDNSKVNIFDAYARLSLGVRL